MSPGGDVRVCSYELGVLVWPGLWDDEDGVEVEMVPTFATDIPTVSVPISRNELRPGRGDEAITEDAGAEGRTTTRVEEDDNSSSKTTTITNPKNNETKKKLIAFRMPYSLPLVPYTPDETPWCTGMTHHTPDWKGRVWNV